MSILKTLLIAPLALLIAMPVYAHQSDYGGHSSYKANKKNHRQKHKYQYQYQHKGHHGKRDRGHHYGWYKKPYYGYRNHGYGHYSHGNRYFDDDGWALILRLSDSF